MAVLTNLGCLMASIDRTNHMRCVVFVRQLPDGCAPKPLERLMREQSPCQVRANLIP